MNKTRISDSRKGAAALLFWVGMLVSGMAVAQQNFPNRPLRIISPPPGGGADFIARLIAQGIAPGLGQPVVVDNRPTNGGFDLAAQSQPDGYTMLMGGRPLWIRPLIENTSYDVIRDFAAVSLVNGSPAILVVHPSVDVRSFKEFVALAKARPGTINFGSSGNAGTDHLAIELFMSMAGIKLTHIPYKGAGAAVTALIGGEIQMMMGTTPTVLPHIKAGKLRALAITTPRRSELAPGIPTIAESGLPGYEFLSTNGVLVRAKTPAPIIARLNQEIVRAVTQPDVKQKILGTGSELIASTSEEFAAKIKAEIVIWGKVIKEAGIRAE